MKVHHHRHHLSHKGKDPSSEFSAFADCGNMLYRRTKRRLLRLVAVFSLICFSLLFALRLLSGSPFFSYTYKNFPAEDPLRCCRPEKVSCSPSMLRNGNMCCDRSSFRADVCYMKGDIRTISSTKTIYLYTDLESNTAHQEEKIKPYTRKWEWGTMRTIDEVTLIKTSDSSENHVCDVLHSVPAIFFSTGGFTGNVYHEFNDGIIPLYITSQRYNKEVIFLILEYHNWWITKYGDVISHLTNYDPIDFTKIRKSHCFPEAIVGLNIHDELTINSSLMHNDPKTIVDFRNLLDDAYRPRIRRLPKEPDEHERTETLITNPKLVIISRTKSREILNQESLVSLAKEIGFQVEVLRPTRMTELAKIYRSLNSSEVMVGVHGAAMTHLLFMRPGTVFIQVVPLGTDWPAQNYYGDPAIKLGLRYVAYKILPRESSLSLNYEKDDPVLTNPQSVTKRRWDMTKSLYLGGQNVTLDLKRFRKRLLKAYIYSVKRRREKMEASGSLHIV